MNILVYRIQGDEGRGPWRPGFSHKWVEDREDHNNLPPWPLEFGQNLLRAAWGRHFGCGCRTLEQLQRWFTPTEYATLQGYGYQAVTMDVRRILAESPVQCVFERHIPLNEYVLRVDLYPTLAPSS